MLGLFTAALLAWAAPECSGTTQLGSGQPRVEVLFDPSKRQALAIFLELRRLVGERPGELAVELVLARPPDNREPQLDELRLFMTVAARHDRLLPALRALDRLGPSALLRTLQEADAAFLQDLGLPADALTRDRACAEDLLARADARLQQLRPSTGLVGLHSPLFVLEHQLPFEDTPKLEQVRPALSRLQKRTRPKTPVERPAPSAAVELSRPGLTGGIRLGGLGLPHRMVLFVRDEEHSRMYQLLPVILQFLARHPGRMSFHLLARGDDPEAVKLRSRLCAARQLGQELAYLRWLAKEPSQRRVPSPSEAVMLAELDHRATSSPCPQERSDIPPDWADGPWLDGVPKTRSDIEQIERSLDQSEQQGDSLQPIIRAGKRAEGR